MLRIATSNAMVAPRPPPCPPKVMQINWGFSLKLQTTTFRAIMHSCMLNCSPPGRSKKHTFSPCMGHLSRPGPSMCPTSGFKWPLWATCPLIPPSPVPSWGRWSLFWAIIWSLMPTFGLEFQFLAPTWHSHTSCCPKLGQRLVASASSSQTLVLFPFFSSL